MALRTIITEKDPLLRKKSKEVSDFGAKTHELLDDMWDTMHEAGGVGLAAVQVGILRRMFVIDIREAAEGEKLTRKAHDGEQVFEMINPVILEMSGERTESEGCLSVPGATGMVVRPLSVRAEAYDRHGLRYEVDADGLLAKAIAHEHDHLEGILYTDIAESVERS